MGEREKALADRLLAADSVRAAETALLPLDGGYDVDALIAELNARRERLTADGERPEADLTAFLIGLVQRRRDAIEEMTRLRDQAVNEPKRTWPADIPHQALSPRMLLERRVSDLVDAGSLDDALAAARRADAVPCEDRADRSVVCTSRWRLAGALRTANRSREAYEVLEDVEFTQVGDTEPAGAHIDSLAVRFHTLRGLLREDMGYYRRGRSSHEAAREAAMRAGDARAQIHAWLNLAASYAKSGMHRHAVRELRRALQFAESLPDPRAVVAPLSNLGRALLSVGEHEAARSCYRRVLATLDELGVDSTSRIAAWFGLGDIAHHLGDVQEAVEAYRTGFLISLGTDGARLALFDLVNRLNHKDLPEDGGLYAMALFFLDMVPGAQEDWLLMMSLRIATAGFCGRRGRHDQAVRALRDLHQEAVDRGVEWLLRRRVTEELAEALLRQADHHRAMAELDGLVRLAEDGGTGHLLHLSPELTDGLAHWRSSGRPEPSAARQEAFDVLWRARQELLAGLGPSPDAHDVAQDHREIYRRLVDVLVDHGDDLRMPDSRPPEELAFDLHEESKSHGFLTHLARAPVAAPDSVPVELRQAEAELLAKLPGPAGGRTDVHRALADVHERMSPYAPGYVRSRRGRPVRFGELRSHLSALPDAAQCAFVSFFCGKETTTVFTYLPRTGRLTVARSPVGTQTIREVANRLRRTFDGAPDDFPPKAPLHPRRPWRRGIDFLGDLTPLLASFLPHVHGRPLLYVSGDGPLHGVPLPAVPTPDGPVLATRHAVVHVAGASAMLYATARHTESRQDGATLFCAGVAAREDTAPERLESDASLLSEAGWPVTALTGTRATRQAVLRGMRDARIAHITCHGYFDPHEPLDSGLLLAQAGERPSKMPESRPLTSRLAHLLTARDIARGALQPSLVTLRACATGLRDEHAGEDLEGLIQALQYAGVKSVVAALWNVDEHSSRQLLTDFYRNLAARPGEPVWRGFWAAQRKMIEEPRHAWQSHPYHWAALALFGDWRRQ
ncbi:CHAT domain-containing tetratricopeptide repeat protein [Actinomadura miaoliensis]|uniref:CHAT domain-containing protein n=1 Tax=Actinomadura miaoliensis TaxID=430685 RepID=A0ABP7WW81_9ACTN